MNLVHFIQLSYFTNSLMELEVLFTFSLQLQPKFIFYIFSLTSFKRRRRKYTKKKRWEMICYQSAWIWSVKKEKKVELQEILRRIRIPEQFLYLLLLSLSLLFTIFFLLSYAMLFHNSGFFSMKNPPPQNKWN